MNNNNVLDQTLTLKSNLIIQDHCIWYGHSWPELMGIYKSDPEQGWIPAILNL